MEETRKEVDIAINRVLMAERDAQAAINACRDRARLILEEARLQAARIKARTDRRIACVQTLSDQVIAQRTADIHADIGTGQARDGDAEQRLECVQCAIETLLKEMV